MNLLSTTSRLLDAELKYAFFNACRTTSGEEGAISLGFNDAFGSIGDPSRPTSSYYNRAVCRQASSLTSSGLSHLPPTTQGLEVPPSSLNHEGATQLLAGGFRPAYALCYLALDLSVELPVMSVSSSPEGGVSRLDDRQIDEFLDLLEVQGALFPPEKRALKRRFYCTSEFVAFVARDKLGTACAWATMYLHGDTAYFGNAFTRPEHRRKGYQMALLVARARHAMSVGATVAYTDVEHCSQSHHNCERAGMRTVSINTIWARDA